MRAQLDVELSDRMITGRPKKRKEKKRCKQDQDAKPKSGRTATSAKINKKKDAPPPMGLCLMIQIVCDVRLTSMITLPLCSPSIVMSKKTRGCPMAAHRLKSEACGWTSGAGVGAENPSQSLYFYLGLHLYDSRRR